MEFEFRDDDGGVGGFAHVVEGEGGGGSAGEGFHFDAGLAGGTGGGGDEEGASVVGGDFYLSGIEGQRVAERNDLGGFLDTHDAGQDRGMEDGAFFVLKLAIFHAGKDVGAQRDEAGGGGGADGGYLAGDVDHARLVRVVEVGEIGHGGRWHFVVDGQVEMERMGRGNFWLEPFFDRAVLFRRGVSLFFLKNSVLYRADGFVLRENAEGGIREKFEEIFGVRMDAGCGR